MQHYEALRQLTHDHCERRADDASRERLAHEARGRRLRRRRRLALAEGLGLLTGARRAARSGA